MAKKWLGHKTTVFWLAAHNYLFSLYMYCQKKIYSCYYCKLGRLHVSFSHKDKFQYFENNFMLSSWQASKFRWLQQQSLNIGSKKWKYMDLKASWYKSDLALLSIIHFIFTGFIGSCCGKPISSWSVSNTCSIDHTV